MPQDRESVLFMSTAHKKKKTTFREKKQNQTFSYENFRLISHFLRAQFFNSHTEMMICWVPLQC